MADIWQQKLGHINVKNLRKILDIIDVRGFPTLALNKGVCGPCQFGKQRYVSHKVLQHTITTLVVELLHMDLFFHMQVESLLGKRYLFIYLDDHSRFTQVDFIKEKSNAFEFFKKLCIHIMTKKNYLTRKIIRIISDHGKEFENAHVF